MITTFLERLSASAFTSIFILTTIFFLPSCKNTNPAFDSLSKIEGTWEMRFDGSAVYEEWQRVNDTLYIGKSYEVSESDTFITETIKLVSNNQGIFYIPTVNDQNEGDPVPFKLTSGEGGRFVFENPNHDFPTQIIYDFKSNNNLNASVSGIIRGELRSLDFEYERVK
jgi:hypothetical protein